MSGVEGDGRAWRRLAGPLFVSRAAGQGLEFLGWVVLARQVGASTFGAMTVAFLVARYGGLIADAGASISGPREVARDDENWTSTRSLVRQRERLTFLLGTLYVSGCLATENSDVIPMVSVVAMLGLSRDWISVGRHRGWRAAVPVLVQGLVLLVGAILIGSDGYSFWAVGCAYAASAATSVILNRLPRSLGDGAPNTRAGRPWMLIAVLANQVLSSADTLLLGLLGTATATGTYAAVYRVPNGWLAGVAVLAGALLPVATSASVEPARLAEVRRSAMKVSGVAAAVLLGLTPVVYVSVPLLFGEDFASGRRPVVVLLIATAVATASAPLHQFFLATRTDRSYAMYLASAAATIVLGSVLLVPAFSMMGAALATLAAHSVLAVALYAALRAMPVGSPAEEVRASSRPLPRRRWSRRSERPQI